MSFTVCLTHDVDRIRKTYQYLTHDVRKRRFGNLKTLFNGSSPYWMFEKIMNIEESYGVRSTFFFLHETIPFEPFNPANWKLSLGRYSIKEPELKHIIRELDAGGWEIGLHGSYNSYKDIGLLKTEKSVLEDVLGKKVTGIRQHYLNLEIPGTWKLQREAGFQYDASFGLLNGVGYRGGKYHPFTDAESGMFVIPLAIMECYLFTVSENNPDSIRKNSLRVIDEAEKNNGVLTLLWHPHMFCEEDFPRYTDVYLNIIEEAKNRGAEFLTCKQVWEKKAAKI